MRARDNPGTYQSRSDSPRKHVNPCIRYHTLIHDWQSGVHPSHCDLGGF